MPVTWMPGISGRFSGRLPYTRTQENDASFSLFDDSTRVQLLLKCIELVGEIVLKSGYTSGVPKRTLSTLVRLNDPKTRSRLPFM